jgi:hypothetical protein
MNASYDRRLGRVAETLPHLRVQQRDVLKAVRGRARLLRIANNRDSYGLRLRRLPEISEALRVLRIEEIDFAETRKGLLSDRDRRAVERDRAKHEKPKAAQHVVPVSRVGTLTRFTCERLRVSICSPTAGSAGAQFAYNRFIFAPHEYCGTSHSIGRSIRSQRVNTLPSSSGCVDWGFASFAKALIGSAWRRRKGRYVRRLALALPTRLRIRSASSTMLHNTSCSAMLVNGTPSDASPP